MKQKLRLFTFPCVQLEKSFVRNPISDFKHHVTLKYIKGTSNYCQTAFLCFNCVYSLISCNTDIVSICALNTHIIHFALIVFVKFRELLVSVIYSIIFN